MNIHVSYVRSSALLNVIRTVMSHSWPGLAFRSRTEATPVRISLSCQEQRRAGCEEVGCAGQQNNTWWQRRGLTAGGL